MFTLRDEFEPHEINGKLTFEVLEDDLADNPCCDVLLAMKHNLGCSFAVDDFYHDRDFHLQENSGVDSTDWARLENLARIVDYVKIDGATVEDALREYEDEKRFDLHPLVAKIKSVVPGACIILERIKDADQAHSFSGIVHAVQGLKLPGNRAEFQEELVAATQNFPPRPKGMGRR